MQARQAQVDAFIKCHLAVAYKAANELKQNDPEDVYYMARSICSDQTANLKSKLIEQYGYEDYTVMMSTYERNMHDAVISLYIRKR